jgi:hypothetical protein
MPLGELFYPTGKVSKSEFRTLLFRRREHVWEHAPNFMEYICVYYASAYQVKYLLRFDNKSIYAQYSCI